MDIFNLAEKHDFYLNKNNTFVPFQSKQKKIIIRTF